jgi:tetratricopeptide (TPR) repeat protein
MPELPDYLRRRPERVEFSPPIELRERMLPFDRITWEHFEALSLELFEQEHELIDSRLYAGRGEDQDGIDLYGVTAEQRYVAAQCRRVRALTRGAIIGVVDDFVGGDWAQRTAALTLFTAASTESRGVAAAIEEQRQRLAKAGVQFAVRDRRSLSNDLRLHPDLVDAYFGAQWRRAFCPGEDQETSRARGQIEAAEILVAAARRPRYLDLESLNVAVRKAVRRLVEDHEDEYPLLEPLLNDPEGAARAARWIANPPAPLANVSWRFWAVVTRIAERGGEWRAGVDGWLKVSEQRGQNVGNIVDGSVAAGVAGEGQVRDELLARARVIDPDHPRVKLQEAGALEEAEDQLELLDGVRSDDAVEQALLELNRALAWLRVPNLDEAEAALQRAEQSPEAAALLQLGVVRANVVVQRNRLAASQHRPTDAQALTRAETDCLKLRDNLIAEHRFDESVRALMLAVDAAALRFDFPRVQALLEVATERELTMPDAPGVLGDAALRVQLPRIALSLTDRAEPTEETRGIRAAAKLKLRQNVETAREELRELALGGGAEAEMAASALCQDSAFHRGRWDEDVAAVIAVRLPVDVLLLKARHLASTNNYGDAKRLLDEHLDDDPRVLHLRFDLASRIDDPEAIDLVPKLLASSPHRHYRLLAADLLLTHASGDPARAESEIRVIIDDQMASAAERSDAYALLLRLLARQERWADARTELGNWIRIDASDERLNFWQVKVGRMFRRGD